MTYDGLMSLKPLLLYLHFRDWIAQGHAVTYQPNISVEQHLGAAASALQSFPHFISLSCDSFDLVVVHSKPE